MTPVQVALPSPTQPESSGSYPTVVAAAGERPREAAERVTSGTADRGPVEQVKPEQITGESEPATSVRAGYAALFAALALALVLLARWALARRDGAVRVGRRRGGAGAAAQVTAIARGRERYAAGRRLITRLKRSQSRTRVVPVLVTENLWLEGKSRDPSIGDVRGFAMASVLTEQGEAREALYLVNDSAKPEPVWLGQSDVAVWSGPAARQATDDAPFAGAAAPLSEAVPADAAEAAPGTGQTGAVGRAADEELGSEEQPERSVMTDARPVPHPPSRTSPFTTNRRRAPRGG